jgi:hypothetical protein
MLQTLMNERLCEGCEFARLYIWDFRNVFTAFGNGIGGIEENSKIMMSEHVNRLADRFEIDGV